MAAAGLHEHDIPHMRAHTENESPHYRCHLGFTKYTVTVVFFFFLFFDYLQGKEGNYLFIYFLLGWVNYIFASHGQNSALTPCVSVSVAVSVGGPSHRYSGGGESETAK